MMAGRRVTLKTRAQVAAMWRAGRVVCDVLELVAAEIRPGMTTADLDAIASAFIRKAGATPSFIGVPGAGGTYRHATCVSIDDEVVHGIPGSRRVEAGQIVSVDVGAIVDGWHADAARSFAVGDVSDAARALIRSTREAAEAGTAAAIVGNHIGDISAAVEDVALAGGFGVVRDYVGHGIGSEMHEEPAIPNYRSPSRGRRLEAGMCLAIEPMFTLGGSACRVRPDGWTVTTADGTLASHWEDTVAILPEGPLVLTVPGAPAPRLSGSGQP
jgi:methionyl aminopeptidase